MGLLAALGCVSPKKVAQPDLELRMPATPEAKELVDGALAKGTKVVIFSKSHCQFCLKAKKTLGELLPPDQITAVEIDERSDIINVQDYLYELTGARSVPRVFVDGKFVGGSSDIEKLASEGKLEPMLKVS